MNKLWGKSPVTAAEIVEKVQKKRDLEVTTIKTLLQRLTAKRAVDFTVDKQNSKLYYYFPIVLQKDCVLEESKQFLHLYYENNLKKMFATFLENAELSPNEIASLKQMLEKKEGKRNG